MAMRWSSFLTGQRRCAPALPEPADRDPRSPELICAWEIPLDPDLAAHLGPGRGYGAAYFPSRWGSVPEAAREALTELICISRPRDMLVAPAGVRRVGGADVYCPTQVLAAGEHGVALWVDDLPFDRVAGVLAYRDIRMVEHRSRAESSYLTVIGAAQRFTLHYRLPWLPGREPRLADLLMRIRLRAAGLANDIGHYGGDRGEVGAASMLVGLDASRVVLSLSAHGRSKWTPWQRTGQRAWRTATLTDREMVVLRTSKPRSAHGDSQDILAVPRNHLRGLSVEGASLRIDAGATHDVTLGAAFARHVVKEFSQIVVEPSSLPRTVATQKARALSVVNPQDGQFNREPRRVARGGLS